MLTASDGLTLRLQKNSLDFEILTPDGIALPMKFVLSGTQKNIPMSLGTYFLAEGLRATLSGAGGTVVLHLNRQEANTTRVFQIWVGTGCILSNDVGRTYLCGAGYRVEVRAENCGAFLLTNGVLSAPILSMTARVEFLLPQAVAVQEMSTVSALSTPTPSTSFYTVPPGGRIPEFSIAVFDDVLLTNPRPIRWGVPVISTVPVDTMGSVALSAADANTLASGQGTPTRNMYFSVICSEELNLSVQPSLNIYLPRGFDLVSAPISVPLVGSGATYTGQYDFHQEDNINYVDGFVYFSVTFPMLVFTAIGMEVELIDVSGPVFDAPNYESVSEF